jgi:hypothetical protein
MSKKFFESGKHDAQATRVDPVKVTDFDFVAYQEYACRINERSAAFWKGNSGVAVYRRMRVAEVFSWGCRDSKQSLEWQLGALQKSMDYEADVPNFLEPWYGIGIIGTAFGLEYLWNPGQSPAVKPAFQTIDDALAYSIKPVKDTPEGRHSLEMIEYFLDKTKGKVPMSMGDIQSPFNNATYVVDTSNFLISMIMDPEKVLRLLDVIADLEIDFYKDQEKLIGKALVRPGHGYASSYAFEGFGMSDDNVVMVDAESYLNYIRPSFVKLGSAFGGPVHHSCGNFSDKTGIFSQIEGLKMVDAAFTPETDPSPNPAAPFADALSGTGIVLNARMVGDPDTVVETTRKLWRPGMKLLVVTFSPTPDEQRKCYELVHSICH